MQKKMNSEHTSSTSSSSDTFQSDPVQSVSEIRSKLVSKLNWDLNLSDLELLQIIDGKIDSIDGVDKY